MVGKPADRLGHVDVTLIAGRHPESDADASQGREERQVAPVGPALAHQPDPTGSRLARLEGRRERAEETVIRVVDAQTVRSDDPHPGRARDLADRGLVASAVVAHFSEPGAENNDGLHPGGGARFGGLDHGWGRDRDDGGVDRARHLADAGEGREALDAVAIRVDRIDGACESRVSRVEQWPPADTRGVVRGADDGDRGGLQEWAQGISGSVRVGSGHGAQIVTDRRTVPPLPSPAGNEGELLAAGGSPTRRACASRDGVGPGGSRRG